MRITKDSEEERFTDHELLQDSEEERFTALTSHEQNQQNITSGTVVGGSMPIASSNDNLGSLCREIRFVQDLIERCLQLYMNKDEAVKTVLELAGIQPAFTRIIWKRLEEENAEFFRAYHTKLILKKQIALFNELLEKHRLLSKYAVPQGGTQHMPVNSLHEGYTTLRQHPFSPTGHPHIDSIDTMSNCHLANDGNFHPTQMNYGRGMVMDNNAAYMVPAQPFIRSETLSPVSVASSDQFPLIPSGISDSMDPLAFDLAESSHVRSERQAQHGPEFSDSTIMFGPPQQNDNVDEFFDDTTDSGS